MKQLFKTKKVLFLAFIFLATHINATTLTFLQEESNATMSYKEFKGKVLDSETQKPLASAHISIEASNINTITNSEGEFSLKVSKAFLEKNIIISFLGYTNKTMPLSQLIEDNTILLSKSITELAEINIKTLKGIDDLIKDVFQKKGENYLDNHAVMTAFYRESIKKRNKNVSLSEAIVNIYKAPYQSSSKDVLKFYKARKNTNYSRLDTLLFKVQGGPYNPLFVDIMKYPEHVFTEETLPNYMFSFSYSIKENNTLIYVIDFKQKEDIQDLLYEGQLFIDYDNKILTSATYALNVTNKKKASNWFTKRKPTHATVLPTKATYHVKYNEKNKKWYYGYSNLNLEFKINSKKKLFSSNYSMSCEMAVTDWKENKTQTTPKYKDRIKQSVVMSDYAVGFIDPNFWGEHNIIEPDKSIEVAIKKIQKQLKKSKKANKEVSLL